MVIILTQIRVLFISNFSTCNDRNFPKESLHELRRAHIPKPYYLITYLSSQPEHYLSNCLPCNPCIRDQVFYAKAFKQFFSLQTSLGWKCGSSIVCPFSQVYAYSCGMHLNFDIWSERAENGVLVSPTTWNEMHAHQNFMFGSNI